ncbi:MAG: hypothetical protein R3356_07250, partial [Eudoraea sp.]|nr:hypothetical protein [Eudoraea sp.]
LRVMSPTSYLLLYPAMSLFKALPSVAPISIGAQQGKYTTVYWYIQIHLLELSQPGNSGNSENP